MFRQTNCFGQSSNSPFNSQFGQTNTASSNPFAPKPFGGTSTGVFGSAQSSPAFGATPSPAFGSSMPSFGASSNPAFGSSSSSSFGGSSVFGQKPSFGGFGAAPTPTQSSPFGSTFQQSQPAFGSSIFGSTRPFGASSQPTFGASSTHGFGASSTPTFGAPNTSAFGAPSTPAFGASSSPSFSFGSTPAFGSSPFGATPSSFAAQTSALALGMPKPDILISAIVFVAIEHGKWIGKMVWGKPKPRVQIIVISLVLFMTLKHVQVQAKKLPGVFDETFYGKWTRADAIAFWACQLTFVTWLLTSLLTLIKGG